jgi:pullulanase-type alpha-1,6-glucosidase
MAGTGIGSFNDRIRVAARGGGPFSGLQEQGFLTGLWTDPNGTDQGSAAEQRDRLLAYQDRIKVSLAGNLRGVVIIDRFGNAVRGDELDYNGLPAGYTDDPQEVINYVEAHDNETLWDAVQLKAAPAAGVGERVRMQMLGMSLVALGQGVPFFHAGVDLLRSKSLDRNSYDSGDWFNALDFSYRSNNWGVGLPPAGENGSSWPIHAPLLADPALAVSEAQIGLAIAHAREVLAIRRSSRLFRLRTAAEIDARLRFFNGGPSQVPGAIGLELSDADGRLDRQWNRIVVLFNGAPARQEVGDPSLTGRPLVLHPIQQTSADGLARTSSFDAATGMLSVPGRTAAVFVELRPASQRIELLLGDVARLLDEGALSAGNANALSAKLRAALAATARGNASAARGALGAFVNQCRALEQSRRLPEEEAEALIAEALEIIALLGRPI